MRDRAWRAVCASALPASAAALLLLLSPLSETRWKSCAFLPAAVAFLLFATVAAVLAKTCSREADGAGTLPGFSACLALSAAVPPPAVCCCRCSCFACCCHCPCCCCCCCCGAFTVVLKEGGMSSSFHVCSCVWRWLMSSSSSHPHRVQSSASFSQPTT